MTAILRAIVVLATAGTIGFPTAPPPATNAKVTTASVRRRAASTPTAPASAPKFTTEDLEYYLTDEGLAWVRPGLQIKVNSITIPAADRKPVVDITITDDKSQPLDRLGQLTPGAVSVSFILAAYDPDTRYYTSYTKREVTTPANSPRPGVKATQASADSGGTWTPTGDGRYTYKFNTALPSGFDQTKTHTLGLYSSRNMVAEGFEKNYYFDSETDFRPDGQNVTAVWD